jgi:hypothetical protein
VLASPLAGCRTRYFVISWFTDPDWCRRRNTHEKRSIICKWCNSCLVLDAATQTKAKTQYPSIHPTAVILFFDLPNVLQPECTVDPATGHGDPEEKERYSSTLSLTLTSMGWVVNATLRPLYRRPQNRHPLYRGLGECRAGLDRCGKYRPLQGLDLRTVQPVMGRYTDWAIPAPKYTIW